jgi:acetyl esterase/lipase
MGRVRGVVIAGVLGALVLASCTSASPTTPAAGPAGGSAGTGDANAGGGAGAPPAPTLAAGTHATLTYCHHQQARITEPVSLHGAAPAAVYVHGGSWVSGDYDTGGFIIDKIGPALADAGFVVVSLDYRLGPRQRWPDQIEDVKCAIRYLRANATQLHIEPAEIGAWGQSAGGHLVALLGTAGHSAGWDVGPYLDKSSEVEAVVDMAGPSDLLTMGDQGDAVLVAESFISLLGNVRPKKLGAELKKASPVNYVAPGDPPFLILDSNNDEIVYPQQSLELAWYLGLDGDPRELVTVISGGHEFDTPGESPSESAIARLVVRYFVQTLVRHRRPNSNTTGSTGSTGSTGAAGSTVSGGTTGTAGSTGSTGSTG